MKKFRAPLLVLLWSSLSVSCRSTSPDEAKPPAEPTSTPPAAAVAAPQDSRRSPQGEDDAVTQFAVAQTRAALQAYTARDYPLARQLTSSALAYLRGSRGLSWVAHDRLLYELSREAQRAGFVAEAGKVRALQRQLPLPFELRRELPAAPESGRIPAPERPAASDSSGEQLAVDDESGAATVAPEPPSPSAPTGAVSAATGTEPEEPEVVDAESAAEETIEWQFAGLMLELHSLEEEVTSHRAGSGSVDRTPHSADPTLNRDLRNLMNLLENYLVSGIHERDRQQADLEQEKQSLEQILMLIRGLLPRASEAYGAESAVLMRMRRIEDDLEGRVDHGAQRMVWRDGERSAPPQGPGPTTPDSNGPLAAVNGPTETGPGSATATPPSAAPGGSEPPKPEDRRGSDPERTAPTEMPGPTPAVADLHEPVGTAEAGGDASSPSGPLSAASSESSPPDLPPPWNAPGEWPPVPIAPGVTESWAQQLDRAHSLRLECRLSEAAELYRTILSTPEDGADPAAAEADEVRREWAATLRVLGQTERARAIEAELRR
jgi:hypothetical protein